MKAKAAQQITDDLRPGHELLRAIVDEDGATVQAILKDSKLSRNMVNWQDELGWTPLIYAAFKGENRLVKKLLNRGASVNHMALSRVGSSADGTTALHACAAMRSAGWSSEQAFYETARVLMLAGGNPFQENLSGLTPIDVAANRNNMDMKMLLEGCALFKGYLNLPVPKLFGGKSADRYCIVLPRFPWHPLGSQNGLLMRDGSPSLALVCYKQPEDLKPVIKIPLDGARVVVEGGAMADEGFLILKAPRKQLKGVVIKTSNSSSSVVEIRARPSQTQTGAQVLQALAEVCKSAAVAAYCGNLGQLCEATMIESLHNLGLADGLLVLPRPAVELGGQKSGPEKSTDTVQDTASEADSNKGRKSLSSRIGKAFRRMSMGDKPKRRSSASLDNQGSESLPEIYPYSKGKKPPTAAAAQSDFTRISEENAEAESQPVNWDKISRELPPVQRPQGRLSLHQDHLPGKQSEERRQSLQLRTSQSREWLTSNKNIPMQFWGDMRDDIMRRSMDARQWLPGGRASSGTSQPPDVRSSFDVGQVTLPAPQPSPAQTSSSARANGIMEERRPGPEGSQEQLGRSAPLPPQSYKRPPAVPSVLLSHKLQAPPAVPSILLSHKSSPRSTGPTATPPPAQDIPTPTTPPPRSRRPSSDIERETPPSQTSAPETPAPQTPSPQAPASKLAPSPRTSASTPATRTPRNSASNPAAATSAAVSTPTASSPAVTRSPRPAAAAGGAVGESPRPAARSKVGGGFFGSTARSSDDLFKWSLRPESRAAQQAAQAKAAELAKLSKAEASKIDPAVARWAAEAAAMVKDQQLAAQGAKELTTAGWKEAAAADIAPLEGRKKSFERFKVVAGNAQQPAQGDVAAPAKHRANPSLLEPGTALTSPVEINVPSTTVRTTAVPLVGAALPVGAGSADKIA